MSTKSRVLSIVLLTCTACPSTTGPNGNDDVETSESSTGDGPGPVEDPEEPLDCWEPLADGSVSDVWGLSTQQLLLATTVGLLRVEGDTITTLESATGGSVWATDLDNGWITRNFAIDRLVDGEFEPWPLPSDFQIRDLDGSGPNDVWAAGHFEVVDTNSTRSAIAHFDGTGWTALDVAQAVPSWEEETASLTEIEVTTGGTYFAATSLFMETPVHQILRWDGDGLTLDLPQSAEIDGLSSRSGEPFVFEVIDDDNHWVDSVYELSDSDWIFADDLLPSFSDWDPVIIDLAGLDDGSLWGIVLDPIAEDLRAVYRDSEGQWRRVRVPEFAGSIHPMSDGAVVRTVTYPPGAYRATIECLFGGG